MIKAPGPKKSGQGAAVVGTREFTGTDNPRHLRALAVLLRRPLPREQLDDIAGCSNGPDLIAELRRRGLHDELYCERITFTDRDGRACRPGVYALTDKGRRLVHGWLARRDAQQGGAV